MIYYCGHCKEYFNENNLSDGIQPDVDPVHIDCNKTEYDEMSESEIIEVLNE